MNIFVLDQDPKVCAKYHNNKHVVKMILETAQLLCGVHHMVESKIEIPYKLSHKNHPCSIWARECIENYVWLCDLGMELCLEYTYRYGKTHSTDTKLREALAKLPDNIPVKKMTPFKLAMSSFPECISECPVESYRKFYETKQHRFKMDWTKRQVPEWFTYA